MSAKLTEEEALSRLRTMIQNGNISCQSIIDYSYLDKIGIHTNEMDNFREKITEEAVRISIKQQKQIISRKEEHFLEKAMESSIFLSEFNLSPTPTHSNRQRQKIDDDLLPETSLMACHSSYFS
jgi:hypothetical protein